MRNIFVLSLVLVAFLLADIAQARKWIDATGKYSIEAKVFGFDDENVILQREDDALGMVKIEQLSAVDQEYLKSKEAEEANNRNIKTRQVWTTRSGLKLAGRVVDYVRDEVIIQRRRGKIYVNDRVYGNLPEVYQKLMLKVVEHFEGVEVPDERALRTWLLTLGGRPRTFLIEGVILEWENGDEYVIPFFVFAESDGKLLKQGWANWLKVQEDHDQRDDHAFRLEAYAAARQQNEQINQQIALMNLNMQAIQAGLTSAWEVTLRPMPGNPSPPRWVVVPGRDSREATMNAVQQNPGFVAGPVRKVSY